jgi:hypothetical protein
MIKAYFKVFFAFIVLFEFTDAHSQVRLCKVDTTHIRWNQNILSWSDFKLVPKQGKFKTALSVTMINYCLFVQNDTLYFRTWTSFSKSKSWRSDSTFDSFDLIHEQTHFDITEYYKRLFWLRVASTCRNEDEIHVEYRKVSFSCDSLQNLYDLQTDHSMNRTVQLEWNEKVEFLLKGVEDYHLQSIPILNPNCKLCWMVKNDYIKKMQNYNSRYFKC